MTPRMKASVDVVGAGGVAAGAGGTEAVATGAMQQLLCLGQALQQTFDFWALQ